jgi:hypothetical protein
MWYSMSLGKVVLIASKAEWRWVNRSGALCGALC